MKINENTLENIIIYIFYAIFILFLFYVWSMFYIQSNMIIIEIVIIGFLFFLLYTLQDRATNMNLCYKNNINLLDIILGLIIMIITFFGYYFYFSNIIPEANKIIKERAIRTYASATSDFVLVLNNKKDVNKVIGNILLEGREYIPFSSIGYKTFKNKLKTSNLDVKKNYLKILNALNIAEGKGINIDKRWKTVNNIFVIWSLLSDEVSKRNYLELDNVEQLIIYPNKDFKKYEQYNFTKKEANPYYYKLYLRLDGMKGSVYFTNLFQQFDNKLKDISFNKDILLNEISNKTKLNKEYIKTNLYSIYDKETGIGIYFLINKKIEKDLNKYKALIKKFDIKKVF